MFMTDAKNPYKNGINMNPSNITPSSLVPNEGILQLNVTSAYTFLTMDRNMFF